MAGYVESISRFLYDLAIRTSDLADGYSCVNSAAVARSISWIRYIKDQQQPQQIMVLALQPRSHQQKDQPDAARILATDDRCVAVVKKEKDVEYVGCLKRLRREKRQVEVLEEQAPGSARLIDVHVALHSSQIARWTRFNLYLAIH